MIFPALHRFAKNRGLLDDIDFVNQHIHCVIRLAQEGSFASMVRVTDKQNRVTVAVSKIPPRNSAAIPCLGADTLNRVIFGFDPNANTFARQTQMLFLRQLEDVYAIESHRGLQTVITFLRSLHESDSMRTQIIGELTRENFKSSEWVTFQVARTENETFLPQWPCMRQWWQNESAKHREAALDPADQTPCIVTGELCNPVRTHGARIKVAPGGLPGGVALVSSDKAAFSSYGFEKSLVSPMSEEAVEGYIRAINWLGDDENSHYRTADTNFLFFSDDALTEDNPGKAVELGWPELLDQPPSERKSAVPIAARKVFGAPNAGQLHSAHAGDAQRFYCLSLSGSSARGIVRGWIDEPLPTARRNVEQWFDDLTIRLDRPLFDDKQRIAEPGQLYNRWPLWQLIACFQGKGEAAKQQLAQQREQLWEAALLGRSYPISLSLLVLATSRIPAAGDVTPARAALIRCILNRLSQQKEPMKPELDTSVKSVAFHCGRLFRMLQGIQNKAIGDSNTTVVSKYYSAASATPASVFGLLLSKTQQHLNKIRGDSPGLAFYFDENLADISGAIVSRGGFPRINDPVAQGEFALGFYFQRLKSKKEAPELIETETSKPEITV